MNEDTGQAPRHELSSIWGDMPIEQLRELADDIKKNGIRSPIAWYELKILDGFHRFLAGQIATSELEQEHDEPPSEEVLAILENIQVGLNGRDFDPESEGDPVDYVISVNARRRELTPDQKAAIIIKLRETAKAGRPSTVDSTHPVVPVTTQKIAQQTGASPSNIARIRTAESEGLVDQVISGELTPHAASLEAKRIRAEREGTTENKVEEQTEPVVAQPTVEQVVIQPDPDAEAKKVDPEKLEEAITKVEHEIQVAQEAPPQQSTKDRAQEVESMLHMANSNLELERARVKELQAVIDADPEKVDQLAKHDELIERLRSVTHSRNQWLAKHSESFIREQSGKKTIAELRDKVTELEQLNSNLKQKLAVVGIIS